MTDKIHSLFSVPIIEIKIPSEFSSIIKFFNSQSLLEPDHLMKIEFGNRSKDSYILDNPKCVLLKNFLLQKISEYGQEVLNLDYSEYKLTQSWISIKHLGETHAPHTHPNSIISGVFYYGEVSESTSKLGFQKIPVSTSYVMEPKYKSNFNPLNGPYFLPVSPGTLYLFPSNLGHFVNTNNTSIPRKSLAFNSVPKKGLGVESFLTEFKF